MNLNFYMLFTDNSKINTYLSFIFYLINKTFNKHLKTCKLILLIKGIWIFKI